MTGGAWIARCVDAGGRERAVTVRVVGDQVLLRLPPGESAVFTGQRAGRLSGVLAVADDALHAAREHPMTGGGPR